MQRPSDFANTDKQVNVQAPVEWRFCLRRRCRCFFRTGGALVLLTRGGRSPPGDVVLLVPLAQAGRPPSPQSCSSPRKLQTKLQSGRCLYLPRLQSHLGTCLVTTPAARRLTHLHHYRCKEDGDVGAGAPFIGCVKNRHRTKTAERKQSYWRDQVFNEYEYTSGDEHALPSRLDGAHGVPPLRAKQYAHGQPGRCTSQSAAPTFSGPSPYLPA